jgi:hypothetical protein
MRSRAGFDRAARVRAGTACRVSGLQYNQPSWKTQLSPIEETLLVSVRPQISCSIFFG